MVAVGSGLGVEQPDNTVAKGGLGEMIPSHKDEVKQVSPERKNSFETATSKFSFVITLLGIMICGSGSKL